MFIGLLRKGKSIMNGNNMRKMYTESEIGKIAKESVKGLIKYTITGTITDDESNVYTVAEWVVYSALELENIGGWWDFIPSSMVARLTSNGGGSNYYVLQVGDDGTYAIIYDESNGLIIRIEIMDSDLTYTKDQ